MNLIKIKRWFYKKIYKDAFEKFNWDIDLKKSVRENCFVVFDTETSHADFRTAKALSLGAFRLEGLKLKLSDHISFKIKNPVQSLESIKVHGIIPDELKEGIEPEQACKEFIKFSYGCVLVGYFTEIDVWVMRNLIKGACGGIFRPFYLDLVDLLEIGDKIPTLEELTRSLNLPLSNFHDALEDAYMTSLVFLKLIKKYENLQIGKLPLRV
ncbi:3'-5' exonuclease [Thermocrinis sp.]